MPKEGERSEPQENRDEAIRKITQNIPWLVIDEQNDNLLQEITKMPDGRSLVPDGFTIDFFHYRWDTI